MDAEYYAMNVLKAIEVIGTTRVERLDGGSAEKLPGRSMVNRELVRQKLAHAGSPDQWKHAQPVLKALGLVEYVSNVGSFLRVRDVADAIRAVMEHAPPKRAGVKHTVVAVSHLKRARSRKQATPRVAAV